MLSSLVLAVFVLLINYLSGFLYGSVGSGVSEYNALSQTTATAARKLTSLAASAFKNTASVRRYINLGVELLAIACCLMYAHLCSCFRRNEMRLRRKADQKRVSTCLPKGYWVLTLNLCFWWMVQQTYTLLKNTSLHDGWRRCLKIPSSPHPTLSHTTTSRFVGFR